MAYLSNFLPRYVPGWRGWVLPIAFVLLWSVASYFNWVNSKLIPSPTDVAETAWKQFFLEDFFTGMGASLYRNGSGFVIGSIFGVLIGLLLGFYKWFDRLFGPSFSAFKQVSLFAWLPLISSWFGYDNAAKILFISLAAFYPVAINTFDGVRSITKQYLEVSNVYGFTRWQLIRKVIFPAALPNIFVGLKLGLIYAWLATIGSEFLLANYGVGLGNIVIRGREAFNVSLIIFGMLIVGLLGTLLNRLAEQAESKVLTWRK